MKPKKQPFLTGIFWVSGGGTPPDTEQAGICRVSLKSAPSKVFLYVDSRLEGNALLTIMAMLEAVKKPALKFRLDPKRARRLLPAAICQPSRRIV